MSKVPKKLRSWRITVLRKKGERLGTVEAPDAATAIKLAIERYKITGS